MNDKTRKEIVLAAYAARRDRTAHPQGSFDSAGRWYPSDREDARDIVCRIRAPSRAFPYSYMQAARSRYHVALLVERAIGGLDVPEDIHRAVHDRLAMALGS